MTARFEEALRKLSPQQLDTLLAEAESMAGQTSVGRQLRVDWGDCIESEHASGLEAQRAAMDDWTKSIEHELNK